MSIPISKAKVRLTTAIDSSSTTIAFQATDTNRALTSVTMANFGTYGYLTINPTGKVGNYEVVRFASWSVSGSTITVGTLTRNLSLQGVDTGNTGYSFAAGTTAIISANHNWFNNLVQTEGAQTVAGVKTFTSSPVVPSGGTGTQAANANDIAAAVSGASGTATNLVKGTVLLSSAASIPANPTVLNNDEVSATSGANKVVKANASGKIDAGFGGSASTLATLDGSTLVVQNPANATATSTASKIPIADSNGTLKSWFGFGGTGADGALSISSGTTTISCANAAVVVKNYTSISITGTGSLAFSNPNSNGTIVILKSQGAVTLTSSATPLIDLTSIGAATDKNGTGWGSSTSTGKLLGGSINPSSWSANALSANMGGIGSSLLPTTKNQSILLFCGSGGLSGNNGGAGGAGGGALYIECNGSLNFTGAIWSKGSNGATGGALGAGGPYNLQGGGGGGGFSDGSAGVSATGSGGSTTAGGGGGGGSVLINYRTLVANSGTITVTAGSGASGTASGGNGGAGTSNVEQNPDF